MIGVFLVIGKEAPEIRPEFTLMRDLKWGPGQLQARTGHQKKQVIRGV